MTTAEMTEAAQKAGSGKTKSVDGKLLMFKVRVGDLGKALQRVSGLARNKTIPVTNHVLMTRTGETLKLRTSSIDQQMEIGLDVGGDGGKAAATADLRKLLEIVRSLPADSVCTMTKEGSHCILKCDKSKFKLHTLPIEDFPLMAEKEYGEPVRLKQGVLGGLIDAVSYAMAHNDIRFYMNGMLLETDGKAITAVGTDGHRLCMSEAELETPAQKRSIIIPDKVALELGKLMGSAEGEVELYASDNLLAVSFGRLRLVTKLLEGKFPDYRRVIPKASSLKGVVSVEREILVQALHRASLLLTEKVQGVHLCFKPGEMGLEFRGGSESSEEVLEIDYDGPAMTLGVNASYALAAVENLLGNTVSIGLRGEQESILIRQEGQESTQAVLMPMRI